MLGMGEARYSVGKSLNDPYASRYHEILAVRQTSKAWHETREARIGTSLSTNVSSVKILKNDGKVLLKY